MGPKKPTKQNVENRTYEIIMPPMKNDWLIALLWRTYDQFELSWLSAFTRHHILFFLFVCLFGFFLQSFLFCIAFQRGNFSHCACRIDEALHVFLLRGYSLSLTPQMSITTAERTAANYGLMPDCLTLEAAPLLKCEATIGRLCIPLDFHLQLSVVPKDVRKGVNERAFPQGGVKCCWHRNAGFPIWSWPRVQQPFSSPVVQWLTVRAEVEPLGTRGVFVQISRLCSSAHWQITLFGGGFGMNAIHLLSLPSRTPHTTNAPDFVAVCRPA